MILSTIPRSKTGTCSVCGDQDVAVVKVGKSLYCVGKCNKTKKAHQQIAKAAERNQVRKLNTYQKQEGIVDSQQELILDIDRVLSRYIRLRDMAADHKVQCFTCSRRLDWKKAHAGHYISRAHLATRFLLKNIQCQCPNCNVTLRGNIQEYTKRLERLEPGLAEWLQEQGHTVEKPSITELKELLFDTQQKLRIVEQKLKNKGPE